MNIKAVNITKLLNEREQTHGSAWYVTGQLLRHLHDNSRLTLVLGTNYALNWIMCLNKLVRILFAPEYKEHWVDLIGWATLVAQDITDVNEDSK